MDKEVELILKKLKIVSEEQERGLYLCDKEHSKLLLDYINKLEGQYSGAILVGKELNKENKKLEDYITNLQQENERLNEQVKREVEVRDYEVSLKEDYKSRIEKAVKYIMSELVDEWSIKNDGYVDGSDLPVNAITPLLDILKGEDNE